MKSHAATLSRDPCRAIKSRDFVAGVTWHLAKLDLTHCRFYADGPTYLHHISTAYTYFFHPIFYQTF